VTRRNTCLIVMVNDQVSTTAFAPMSFDARDMEISGAKSWQALDR